MQTILVPTDFSDYAKNALDLAVQIAQKKGGKIILVHVIEPIKSYVAATDGMYIDASVEQKYIDYLIETAQDQLKKLIDAYEGVEIKPEVKMGTIFSAINELVDGLGVDLIVTGTQGVSGLDEILIGSNTEKVVRTARCPVLTVKSAIKLEDCQSIAFATTLKKEQLAVVSQLKELQALMDATIHLVYVNMPNDFCPQRVINRSKDEFIEAAQLENYTFQVYNEMNEENGIIYFSEDVDASMIAVVTHQRTGLAHLFAGSIAEDIVNHANRPVLTFGLKYLNKLKEA